MTLSAAWKIILDKIEDKKNIKGSSREKYLLIHHLALNSSYLLLT